MTYWYIDGQGTGSQIGTSWATPWRTLAQMTGIISGDTVYIAGGPQGSSQVYSTTINPAFPTAWLNLVNGVTYQIGQDIQHNGLAIFDATGATGTNEYWLALTNKQNIRILGDAGDGQSHFKLINAYKGAYGQNCKDIRIAFVDFLVADNGLDFNPGLGSNECDHCTIYLTGFGDHAFFALWQGTGWDNNRFHHNNVFIPYSPSNGHGSDGLQFNGSGFSIYSNNIIGYNNGSYTGQHPDGWQGLGNIAMVKIFNNYFQDIPSYPIYAEPFVGGYSGLWIYNNICMNTDFTSDQAIVVGATTAYPSNDVLIANNVTDNYRFPFSIRDPSGSNPLAFTGCRFFNNVNIAGINQLESTIISGTNLVLTRAQAQNVFVSYTSGQSGNNYMLTNQATGLINQGTSLNSYFSIDKNGVFRPQGAAWDIGAYEFILTSVRRLGRRPKFRGPSPN